MSSLSPEFRFEVASVLREFGWTIVKWVSDGLDCKNEEGATQSLGLSNLYRRVKNADRKEWPEMIRHFMKSIFESVEPGHKTDDLHEVAGQLLVRLGRKFSDDLPGSGVWNEPIDETGLVKSIVIDHPQTMMYVTNDLVEKSGRPGDEWLAIGLDRLRELTPEGFFEGIGEDTSIYVGSTGDAYDAARALVVEELLPEECPAGCWVAVPCRDLIFALAVRMETLQQAHLLQYLAQRNFETKPYPISEEIFWVHEGVWRPFKVLRTKDNIQVFPPQEFLDVLSTVFPSQSDDSKEDDPGPGTDPRPEPETPPPPASKTTRPKLRAFPNKGNDKKRGKFE
jgi:hypothetical protein